MALSLASFGFLLACLFVYFAMPGIEPETCVNVK